MMGRCTIMGMSKLAQNCPTPEPRKAREILLRLMNAAIESVEPSRAMRRWVGEFEIEGYEKVVVVGGGKAGVAMAMTLEQCLGDRLTQGIVNIPRGTMPELSPASIELVEASHPIPDERGMEGARRMLELVSGNGERRGHWRPKSGIRPECRGVLPG
jgi:hydroxypyruvate reductase